MEQVNKLLEKYNNFKYEQIRSIQQLSDSSKIITLVILDDEGEDVSKVEIEFKDINASKLLIDDALPYLDMTSGITFIKENGLYGFGIGKGNAMLNIRNSPLYIVASEVNIKEI
ncbi:hypothetical protein N9A28_10025 [Sulfurimonas sp.]|nr:hypothetical protein [Sulfurimonas sp.]